MRVLHLAAISLVTSACIATSAQEPPPPPRPVPAPTATRIAAPEEERCVTRRDGRVECTRVYIERSHPDARARARAEGRAEGWMDPEARMRIERLRDPDMRIRVERLRDSAVVLRRRPGRPDSVLMRRAALGMQVTATGSLRDTIGVFVTQVTPRGPAENAGIVEGDRIVSVNGVDLRIPRADVNDSYAAGVAPRRLARELEKLQPGARVNLRVYSGGRYRNVVVTAGRYSDVFRDSGAFSFGFGGPNTFVFPEGAMPPGLHFRSMPGPEFRRLHVVPRTTRPSRPPRRPLRPRAGVAPRARVMPHMEVPVVPRVPHAPAIIGSPRTYRIEAIPPTPVVPLQPAPVRST